ncbi:hypothetical protein JMUB7526_28560 [Staphylococcus aureus]
MVLLRRRFFQAEDGIRDLRMSRGLGDVYKRQRLGITQIGILLKNKLTIEVGKI